MYSAAALPVFFSHDHVLETLPRSTERYATEPTWERSLEKNKLRASESFHACVVSRLCEVAFQLNSIRSVWGVWACTCPSIKLITYILHQ